MRRTWYAYQCDDCGAQAPRDAHGNTQPVDGAIYTWPLLRTEIKQMGWQNYNGKDYCPACEQKHRGEADPRALGLGKKNGTTELHRWLSQHGWERDGEARMGMVTQFYWRHPLLAPNGKTTSAHAEYIQLRQGDKP